MLLASRSTSGRDEHTVQRLAQRMSVLNAQLPEGDRYGEYMSAKKLLISVTKASQYLSSLANAELDDTPKWGQCWRPAVREQPAELPGFVTPELHPVHPELPCVLARRRRRWHWHEIIINLKSAPRRKRRHA